MGRNRSTVLALVGVGAIGALVPLLYALFTGHIWEDYFITFRFSANLVHGHGLVFQPGERVHGFTSPLGVLLPALLYWLTGAADYAPALWLFRILGSLAFGGATVLGCLAATRATGRWWAGALAAALLCLDPKSVSFTVNGMETGFMLLFVAAGLYLSQVPAAQVWPRWAGVFAGLQWTRPDGVVFGLGLIAANLLFAPEGQKRIQQLAAFAKAAALAIVLYLPWLGWAWWYYGSPVPHTIIAKAGAHVGAIGLLARIGTEFWTRTLDAFSGVYPFFGGWSPTVRWASGVLGVGALTALVLPGVPRMGRVAGTSFLAGMAYMGTMYFAYPWYYPPVALLGIVAWAVAAGTVGGRALALYSGKPARFALGAIAAAVLLERLHFSQGFWRQMAAQQRVIEDGHRKQVGLYLRDRVRPGETVYLECLGYIGYFSNAHMLDHPGLVTPRVAGLLKGKTGDARSVGAPIPVLRPDWLVLRPNEVKSMSPSYPNVPGYQLMQLFNASKAVESLNVPGKGYLEYDSVFLVYHRAD